MAAERGAHLTSTTTTAGDRQDVPSIFEVLAQENLMTSLRPAIKHVARVCGSNLPSRLIARESLLLYFYNILIKYSIPLIKSPLQVFSGMDTPRTRNFCTKYSWVLLCNGFLRCTTECPTCQPQTSKAIFSAQTSIHRSHQTISIAKATSLTNDFMGNTRKSNCLTARGVPPVT